MSIQKRLIYMVLGGFLALSLFVGAFATFAQTGGEDPAEESNEESTVPEVQSEEGTVTEEDTAAGA